MASSFNVKWEGYCYHNCKAQHSNFWWLTECKSVKNRNCGIPWESGGFLGFIFLNKFLCFKLSVCILSLRSPEQLTSLNEKKKGRKSLESTSFNQALFYDPAAPISLLDFGGCEVTCVNVPPWGREANTNWGIDRFKWSRNTRRNSGSSRNEYWGAGHAGTLMVFIHCSLMQVNILLSTVTWVYNSSVLS